LAGKSESSDNGLMDLNKIGLAVGVLAFILAIPLAVIANLLTPKVRDWYSTTSLKRINRRLIELAVRLKTSEGLWTFTPAEWEIYRAGFRRTQASAIAMVGIFYAVIGVMLMGLFFYKASGGTIRVRTLPWSDRVPLELVLLIATLAIAENAVDLVVVTRRYQKHFYMHTATGRDSLRVAIEALKAVRSRYGPRPDSETLC
jgi:hypothetical protein